MAPAPRRARIVVTSLLQRVNGTGISAGSPPQKPSGHAPGWLFAFRLAFSCPRSILSAWQHHQRERPRSSGFGASRCCASAASTSGRSKPPTKGRPKPSPSRNSILATSSASNSWCRSGTDMDLLERLPRAWCPTCSGWKRSSDLYNDRTWAKRRLCATVTRHGRGAPSRCVISAARSRAAAMST